MPSSVQNEYGISMPKHVHTKEICRFVEIFDCACAAKKLWNYQSLQRIDRKFWVRGYCEI